MGSIIWRAQICNSAPSEILAEVAMQNRPRLIERNLGIIVHNVTIVDDFFARHIDLFTWARPQAGSMAFPRLLKGNMEEFCDRLVGEAGVRLLSGPMYDDRAHRFRLRLGRKSLPKALETLEGFVSQ